MDRQNSCRITEIFHSLQGESNSMGWPTVFVRLTGCPLRCGYCDTEYAFHGGERLTHDAILEAVSQYRVDYVCVTGGEPLAQPSVLPLLTRLCDRYRDVSIETSGACDIATVDKRVRIVMDLKTPGSLQVHCNRYDNIAHLKPTDEVKFVITDRADYDWAKAQIHEHDLTNKTRVLISPSYQQVSPKTLASWVLEDQLPIRCQMQLHKAIWGDEPGR